MEVSEVLCMKLVRDTQTGKVAAPASGPREPRWLDALERDATLPKLNSYLLGNRSSRPGQVLNSNLAVELRAEVPCLACTRFG
jgi:hypothetical protein